MLSFFVMRTIYLITVLLLSSAFTFYIQFFAHQKVVASISDRRLLEASGMDESYKNPGYFWTHNDSGGDPSVYLINQSGEILMEVKLEGVENRDWEEIVTIEKGGKSFIYIAETGDNRAVHEDVSLIQLEEPKFDARKVSIPREEIQIMRFKYGEGARDVEAVFFDCNINEFVLVTKREEHPYVYSFAFEEADSPITISARGTIPKAMYTAADMNEEGEILLKHYGAIYYWKQSEQSAVDRILAWEPISVDYTPEPQGEAICWYEGDFYTISEKNRGKPQEMLFFERMR